MDDIVPGPTSLVVSMDLKWPLRIVEERLDGVLVLALAGRLAAASAVRFDAAVAAFSANYAANNVLDHAALRNAIASGRIASRSPAQHA